MTLFDEFDDVKHQQWIEQITSDLKGKDFDANLITKTEDGFDIQPIYNSENLSTNLANTYQLGNENPDWEIREQIIIDNIREANRLALHALKGGANSIQFNGEIKSQEEMSLLLDEIIINIIHLHFHTHNPLDTQNYFDSYLKSNNINPIELNYSISYDYLGEFLLSGNENLSFKLKSSIAPINKTESSLLSDRLEFTFN